MDLIWLKIKVSAELRSFLEVLGENLCSCPFRLLAQVTSLRCRTEVPISLLNEGHSQLPEATYMPWLVTFRLRVANRQWKMPQTSHSLTHLLSTVLHGPPPLLPPPLMSSITATAARRSLTDQFQRHS